MHPTFFGESRDITKRQLMPWLDPEQRWAVHPMRYDQRPHPPTDRAFLNQYSVALDVDIVGGESANENAFVAAAEACKEHLLLDPDTGLGNVRRRGHLKHVSFDQFVRIVNSQNRVTNSRSSMIRATIVTAEKAIFGNKPRPRWRNLRSRISTR